MYYDYAHKKAEVVAELRPLSNRLSLCTNVGFLLRHLCCTLAFMIKVVVLAVIELKQVLKIVEDLADYIALGVNCLEK
jgi:hypothetical protein